MNILKSTMLRFAFLIAIACITVFVLTVRSLMIHIPYGRSLHALVAENSPSDVYECEEVILPRIHKRHILRTRNLPMLEHARRVASSLERRNLYFRMRTAGSI